MFRKLLKVPNEDHYLNWVDACLAGYGNAETGSLSGMPLNFGKYPYRERGAPYLDVQGTTLKESVR